MKNMVNWYVAQTLPGQQERAGLHLKMYAGVEVFAPQEALASLVRQREVVRTRYLFGTYLLVGGDLSSAVVWQRVVACLGVARIIGGAAPLALRAGVVDELRGRLGPDGLLPGAAADGALRRFKEGDVVRVEEGAWIGFVGPVAEGGEVRGRIKVLLTLFGREVPVPMGVGDVEIVEEAGGRDLTAVRYDRAVRGSSGRN